MNEFFIKVIILDLLAIGLGYVLWSYIYHLLARRQKNNRHLKESKINWLFNILFMIVLLYVNVDIVTNHIFEVESVLNNENVGSQFVTLNMLTVMNIWFVLIINIQKVGLFNK